MRKGRELNDGNRRRFIYVGIVHDDIASEYERHRGTWGRIESKFILATLGDPIAVPESTATDKQHAIHCSVGAVLIA